jgi:hypothetical protein
MYVISFVQNLFTGGKGGLMRIDINPGMIVLG